MEYIHTMGSSLRVKTNEVLIQVTIWMSLKVIMLSEISYCILYATIYVECSKKANLKKEKVD